MSDRWRGLASACVIALGCGRAPGKPHLHAPADMAAPAPRDAAAGDLSTDGAAPSDMPSQPLAGCVAGSIAALPSGVSAGADGQSWKRACADHTLALALVDDGTLRLRRLDASGATHRSWAVVAAPVPVAAQAGALSDGTLVICTAALVARVDSGCSVSVDDAGGTRILDGDGYDAATHVLGHTVAADAHFFGLGSQTGAAERRGRAFTLWSTDAYDPAHGGFAPDAAPLYPSIPFLVAVRGATSSGLFVDDTHRLTFDVAAANPSRLTVATGGGAVDEYLFAGPRPADVLDRYTRLTGRPMLPPRWALGFHQSRWGYFPDTEVQAIADGLRARHIPADGLWLDIQHMNGFRSFTWDPTGFADPAALVSSLGQKGFKTTVIVDPGIKVDTAWDIYQSGLAGNAFLTNPDGSVYVGSAWPGACAFPDFSAPATRAWWQELVARPLGLGVRGLWIDMNEPTNVSAPPVPTTLPAAGDGVPTTMAELHNAYALLEARATYEGMKQAAPSRRPFIVSRAGFAGLQRYAGVWTGDAPSDFTTLAETPAMMLGIGVSGIALVGSDVGGYSGNATPELYARWMQVGELSPFFRAHVTKDVPGQEPWMLGPEVEAVSRAAIDERYTLLPYWYSLFASAHATGAPPLAPLWFAFPDDAATLGIDDEAMVGPWLLFAPVVTAGATQRRLYLPPGRWYELRSTAPYDGGATIVRDVTLGELPAFARAGALLPRAPVMDYSDAAPLDPLTLEIFPSSTPSSFVMFEDAGDGGGATATVTYAQRATSGGVDVTASARAGAFVPPARTLRVHIRGAGAAPTAATLDGAPVAFSWDADDATIEIAFADRAPFALHVAYDRTAPPAAVVHVPVRVAVPAGTSQASPIYVASSANAWMQQPLTWNADGTAGGTIAAPRGSWIQYKYTRGDWSSVEKASDCSELANRYVLAAAHPGGDDSVARWADGCH